MQSINTPGSSGRKSSRISKEVERSTSKSSQLPSNNLVHAPTEEDDFIIVGLPSQPLDTAPSPVHVAFDAAVMKASKHDDPDTFSYEEAIDGQNRGEWIKAGETQVLG